MLSGTWGIPKKENWLLRARNLGSPYLFRRTILILYRFPPPAGIYWGPAIRAPVQMPSSNHREGRSATLRWSSGIEPAEDDHVVIFELEDLEGTRGFGITESTAQDVRICSGIQVYPYPLICAPIIHWMTEGRVDLPVKKCGRGGPGFVKKKTCTMPMFLSPGTMYSMQF